MNIVGIRARNVIQAATIAVALVYCILFGKAVFQDRRKTRALQEAGIYEVGRKMRAYIASVTNKTGNSFEDLVGSGYLSASDVAFLKKNNARFTYGTKSNQVILSMPSADGRQYRYRFDGTLSIQKGKQEQATVI